jgi:hypothetical protein
MKHTAKFRYDMLRISIRFWWKGIKIQIASMLIKLAGRVYSPVVTRFAYNYTSTNWEDYQEWCWQEARKQAEEYV